MQAAAVDALIARLQTLAQATVTLIARHPVIQAWLAGKLDRERALVLHAQIYHQVAQTVPLLERSAATCARLAATDPLYAALARHYAAHAREERLPAPHDQLLLERLRRQGFPVDRLPEPFPPLRAALERAWWAAEHTPLYELGRAWVKEAVSQYFSPRVARAADAPPDGAGPVDFYQVHAAVDQGHSAENVRILRELSAYPLFAAKAGEILAGAEDTYEQTRGSLACLDGWRL
jgi:hypothetical protein